MNIRKKKLGAFKDELIALYRKHGVSIGHEDHHGAFIIRDLQESDIRWIKNATNEATDELRATVILPSSKAGDCPTPQAETNLKSETGYPMRDSDW